MDPFESTASPPLRQRRQLCGNCNRPQPVCLCHVIPETRILTRSKIIILHHPHESHHKLNTTPLLTKSLLHVTIIPGRRLLPAHLSNHEDQPLRAIYLFPPSPSSPAVTLSHLRSSCLLNQEATPLTLIVFDATWKHAKEMVRASEEVLRAAGALRVCLDTGFNENIAGGSIYDSELVLRKEPFGGCVSTIEAVARCLAVIEPDGLEIEEKLIRVLREMVRLQAGFLKPVKPRPKLLKNGKQNEEKTESLDSSTDG